jgi:hypothetical protein
VFIGKIQADKGRCGNIHYKGRSPGLMEQDKNSSSSCFSPNNSDDEEEEEVENKEGDSIVIKEISTTGLVFGHNNSDDESDE